MKTWEEAARRAADKILEADPKVYEGWDLKHYLHGLAEHGSTWPTQSWGEIGMLALKASTRTGLVGHDLNEVVKTVISKQHDYGHQNILAYGMDGVCVRLSDKWARIQNLEKKGVDAQNESLLDSYLDLVGYCIIAIMLCEGTFELPLEEDLPKTTPEHGLSDLAMVWFIKREVKLAIDAHLAAFHPSKMPNSGGIYVGDVPQYNPYQGAFPWNGTTTYSAR